MIAGMHLSDKINVNGIHYIDNSS